MPFIAYSQHRLSISRRIVQLPLNGDFEFPILTVRNNETAFGFNYYFKDTEMSVKVAVRVRPFNSRERKMGCECIVDMQDPSTKMLKYEDEEERTFTFDYSFWSYDCYKEADNGYLTATSPKYADQQQVFEKIGKTILDNAWQGYHCCLFAYGQTGSGKSYSMIGYGENKGIVPITCNDIFERTKVKKPGVEYEVYASMLEIYNEVVQDLTIPISERTKSGLKIRQNKLLGVYVDGVKKHFVSSFDEIENVMESGTQNRTVAATQMNATSSRAHTVITVEFKQINSSTKSEKISMINLVDLAGSERQDKTKATGQRLKEAVGINQSLTTLGQVISVLADNSEGKNNFVPYRNSALTRILQNALGGNSQTIMICAISPASDNYDETLSTLRYAERAKKIKNKPIVNESESDKMIRELKEENQRLKKLLAGKGGAPVEVEKKGQGEEKKEEKKEEDKDKEEFDKETKKEEDQDTEEDLKAKMKSLDERIAMETHTKEEKAKEFHYESQHLDLMNSAFTGTAQLVNDKDLKKMQKSGKTIPPYFQNISRDIMIHRKLKVMLTKEHITIGKPNQKPPNDIIFGGRDIHPFHSQLRIIDGKVFLKPLSESCHLYVNGQAVYETKELCNLDRVVFGWNSVYLFKNKDDKKTDEKIKDKDITWDFVKDELEHIINIDKSDSEDGGSCCTLM